MACFIVPLAQAVATTLYRRHVEKQSSLAPSSSAAFWGKVAEGGKGASLRRLELMLWGGSAMLIVDHIISGELMPVFPFFSALLVEGGALTMLREMLTVGVPMSLLVTGIWALTVIREVRAARVAKEG